jgi:hypothetical protein
MPVWKLRFWQIRDTLNRNMPTVLRLGPYRFFFYAGDREEPQHIHVERDEHTAKFWLEPVRLQKAHGFTGKELRKIQRLVESRQIYLLESWDEYFQG